jgi:hypothetical protein
MAILHTLSGMFSEDKITNDIYDVLLQWRNQTSPPYLVLDALSKYALQRGYSCVPAEIVNYNITELRTYSEEVDVERGNCR